MHGPIAKSACCQLANRRRAINMIDGLKIDVLCKIEMAIEASQHIAPLLIGHRAGDNVDAIARNRAHHEIAAMLDPRFAELLRLAVDFATMNDAGIGGKK